MAKGIGQRLRTLLLPQLSTGPPLSCGEQKALKHFCQEPFVHQEGGSVPQPNAMGELIPCLTWERSTGPLGAAGEGDFPANLGAVNAKKHPDRFPGRAGPGWS